VLDNKAKALQVKRATYILSIILTVVAALACGVSFLSPAIFRDPPVIVGSARGTALVMLIVAIPTLLASMIFSRRGSLRALITWLGAVIEIAYNAAVFAFSIHFDSLFLMYVAMFSLSVWSIVSLVPGIDVEAIRQSFSSRAALRRGLAVYSFIAAAFFFVFWMGQVLPAALSSSPPVFLEGTGWSVNPFHVLDLGFTIPVTILGAVWLWKQRAWGFLIIGSVLTYLVIETTSIATDQWFGSVADPTSAVASAAAVPLFAVLSLVGLVPLSLYFRSLRVVRFT
jgi:hypothetical protein